MHWPLILLVGAVVGFLGGLLGKGGSALATPLLHAAGVPAFVAVAAPLPAAIPSTLVAAVPYWRERLVDRRVVAASVLFGVPATIAGAVASRWVGGASLVHLTDVLLVAVGVRTLARRHGAADAPAARPTVPRMAAAAVAVGLVSGLLANSGGFLLVPLYLTVLRLPIKPALGSSLVVSCALALPGTTVHVVLGHVDWRVVAVFGAASVPLARAGARVALRTDAARLERVYGASLAVIGAVMLVAVH